MQAVTVTGGGPESVSKEEFTWVNTMLGNVKNAITETYHALNPNTCHVIWLNSAIGITEDSNWKICFLDPVSWLSVLGQCQAGVEIDWSFWVIREMIATT